MKKNGRKRAPKPLTHNTLKISERLWQVRGGRSQNGWGQELGVPQQNISRFLSGGTAPHVDFLIHLAKKERINMNWLLLGEGRMKR